MPNPKVVILCMENHSFDEYFGTFPGAVGFYDPNGTEQFTQAGFSEAPVLQPFRTSTFSTSAEWHASYAHWWPEQHEAWNYGALSGWSVQDGASVKLPSGETVEEGAGVMGYFAANDIPYHWNLAENFLLCDSYFCSVLGPTFANRIALMSGTIFDPEVPLPTGTPVIPWGINPPPPAVADGENVPTIDNTSAPSLTWLSYPGILAEKNESCTWTTRIGDRSGSSGRTGISRGSPTRRRPMPVKPIFRPTSRTPMVLTDRLPGGRIRIT
jgi:hypothetical protein